MKANDIKKTKIILFGVGALSKYLTNQIKDNIEIVAYLASCVDHEVGGRPIISMNQLTNIEYDYVVVAFGNTLKGIEILQKNGIPDEKIVGYANSGQTYKENVLQQIANETFHSKIWDEKITEIFNLPQKNYYICGMNVKENSEVISQDFVREQTLTFLAEEVYRKNVIGAVAEIGVASGVFASKINQVFSDRTCYLFDTFSGLPLKDKSKAVSMGWGEKQYAESENGTDPDKVLDSMPYPEKCVIKKGIFPDTFDVNEPFAFVSLDVDFYDTVLAGLELIYPRLSKGGYIMVHDFHNLTFEESRDATLDFCDKYGAVYVPIPDCGGTVVIGK